MEVISSVGFSASFFHGFPNHAHPAREVWRGKLGDIKHDGFLISSVYEEVKFGEIYQTVGLEGLGSLVNETRVVSYLHSGENAN